MIKRSFTRLLKRLLKNNIFRLSLLYSGLFFIASIVMLAIAYKTIDKNIEQSIEKQIDTEISRFIGNYNAGQLGIKPHQYVFFLEKDGQKLAGNISEIPQPDHNKKLIEVTPKSVGITQGLESKGDIVGKTVSIPNNDAKLFIGKSSYDETQRKRDIIDALSTSLLSLLIIGFLGSLIISYRSMIRIDRISKVSRAIRAGNLQLRIPTSANRDYDDIEDLVQNLNQMLDRIDSLMQGMKQVSNNIAHDLRTPLTRLRGNIETIAITRDQEAKELAENALQEIDNILETFTSLLHISQLESGTIKTNFTEIRLDQICHELIDFYEVLAEEKEQTIIPNIQENITVKGDKNLISQAFVNVLTNAIKYSPEKSSILITLKQEKNKVTLIIHDSGNGVPDAYLEKISERFFRLEKHRNQANGFGLGLALVKAIIQCHDAKIIFENDSGLKVSILFNTIYK